MRSTGRRTFDFTLVAFGVLFIPLSLWMCARGTGYDKPRDVTPPDWVISFDDYLKWRPSTRFLQTARDENGAVMIIAEGPWKSIHSSGPSAYVFNANGELVDWDEDSQEGFWYGYGHPADVKVAEVRILVQGKVSERDWIARYLTE